MRTRRAQDARQSGEHRVSLTVDRENLELHTAEGSILIG